MALTWMIRLRSAHYVDRKITPSGEITISEDRNESNAPKETLPDTTPKEADTTAGTEPDLAKESAS